MKSIKERFEEKVDCNGKQMPHMTTKCFAWKAYKYDKGYGRFYLNKDMKASRAAWLIYVGNIPNTLQVLHKCDNPECTKLEHLFLGTHKDNMQDMSFKKRGRGQSKNYCPQGHEYTAENTYTTNGRQCKICTKNRALKSYYKKKELNAAR